MCCLRPRIHSVSGCVHAILAALACAECLVVSLIGSECMIPVSSPRLHRPHGAYVRFGEECSRVARQISSRDGFMDG